MAFDAYLMFDDPKIAGESTSDIHPGSIEMKTYDFGITMAASPGRSDGGGATTGRANFNEFTCEKNIDLASPHLAYHCAAGTLLKKVTIKLHLRTGDPNKPHNFLTLTYTDCVITECTIQGSGGDDLPAETLKINYGAVKLEYAQPPTAKSPKNNRFEWSQVTNTGTKS
jgi:type VI secretion system secreted protein Hcp